MLSCSKITEIPTFRNEKLSFLFSLSQAFIIVLIPIIAFVQDSNQMVFQKIFLFPLSLYVSLFIVLFVDKYVEYLSSSHKMKREANSLITIFFSIPFAIKTVPSSTLLKGRNETLVTVL